MAKTAPRYSIVQVRQVIDMLDAWITSSNETLDNENDKPSPNDERIEALETRIDALQEAKDALENIE